MARENALSMLDKTHCAFAAITKVLAEDDIDMSSADEVELKNYKIDFYIEEHEEVSASEVAELVYGETITINYNLKNEEDSVMTIVGLGGAFLDPLSGDPLVNMTANSVEPIILQPEESTHVRQKVTVDFPLRDYILAPNVYVAFKDQLKGILPRGQPVSLSEPPVSLLHPKLLFLELLFLGAIAAYVYQFHRSAVELYFKDIAPETKLMQSSGSASGSWLPKTYQTAQKKPKARKSH
ncbi:hypothetical protein METBIDRAFT_13309 [Metschnikowia bicuspidata var. bicuspidata NRRL YB-4993]|uniref:Increased recombination centers protein 22 n=1 Tax=Metschnikowia bicuspidata var. bicuspidata NRRL YB-4993 TaxID=869754 RepID=A0A1A0H6L5_9ASCO|nr:hypothetical protein METBIDRAFT_13309 [Metschnikowia bicuspidata var. bicuspidata NRRL YB-4993]OBA19553.1 hypothetical protein METBIDRAFT_13309 [Metschnikowia bicuspidata var. bicuspidata NRRL YB-4993]